MSAKRFSIRLSTIENLIVAQSTIDPGSQVTRTRNFPKTFFWRLASQLRAVKDRYEARPRGAFSFTAAATDIAR